MKCPSCQTYLTKIPINWKCPRCGEKLPDPSRWYLFYLGLMEYLENKGAIFWSMAFALLLFVVGAVEALTGRYFLLSYLGNSIFVSIFGIFYGGMVIDMGVKVNLPLRLAQGSDFIIRERAVIRKIRQVTNLSALVGFIFCLFWLKPRTFLEYFPSYPIAISWFMALGWAVTGLFLDVRMVEDVRFRAYMDRLGITSLKRYRRIGSACIGLLIASAISFNVLINVHGLWIKFSNTQFVGTVVSFAKLYFGWLF